MNRKKLFHIIFFSVLSSIFLNITFLLHLIISGHWDADLCEIRKNVDEMIALEKNEYADYICDPRWFNIIIISFINGIIIFPIIFLIFIIIYGFYVFIIKIKENK